MSRHSQPKSSGGWISLICAVVIALGGASLAGNVAAGPGRVAIGWASLLGAALFLLQFRTERQSSLRMARIDHARRRDALRLREELAEAHHRSRLAVERSYAAVARAEALAAEVARLTTVIRTTPIPVPSVQVLPVMTPAPPAPAPVAPAPPAPVEPMPEPRPLSAVASAEPRTPSTLELPLVGSGRPTPAPVAAASAQPRSRVDLRSVDAPKYARGA